LLIRTLRSRGPQAGEKSSKTKKDMHKTNIIMMSAREQVEEGDSVSGYTLMSLCSQGVLAEWQVVKGEDAMEIDEGTSQEF
jgi:hypothetical protein